MNLIEQMHIANEWSHDKDVLKESGVIMSDSLRPSFEDITFLKKSEEDLLENKVLETNDMVDIFRNVFDKLLTLWGLNSINEEMNLKFEYQKKFLREVKSELWLIKESLSSLDTSQVYQAIMCSPLTNNFLVNVDQPWSREYFNYKMGLTIASYLYRFCRGEIRAGFSLKAKQLEKFERTFEIASLLSIASMSQIIEKDQELFLIKDKQILFHNKPYLTTAYLGIKARMYRFTKDLAIIDSYNPDTDMFFISKRHSDYKERIDIITGRNSCVKPN